MEPRAFRVFALHVSTESQKYPGTIMKRSTLLISLAKALHSKRLNWAGELRVG